MWGWEMGNSGRQPGLGRSKVDSAIHRINHYSADKYEGNQLLYPLDGDLSGGLALSTFRITGVGPGVCHFDPTDVKEADIVTFQLLVHVHLIFLSWLLCH